MYVNERRGNRINSSLLDMSEQVDETMRSSSAEGQEGEGACTKQTQQNNPGSIETLLNQLERNMTAKFEKMFVTYGREITEIKETLKANQKEQSKLISKINTSIHEMNNRLDEHVSQNKHEKELIDQKINYIEKQISDTNSSIENVNKNLSEELEVSKTEIRKHHTGISKLYTEIADLKTANEKINTKIDRISNTNIQERSNISTNNSILFPFISSQTLPKFNGDRKKNPVLFLQSLDQFFIANQFSEIEKLRYVPFSLVDAASEWWLIISLTVNSYADFKEEFKNKFWDQITQRKVYDTLVRGRYSSNGSLSREEYATRTYYLSLQLEPKISEHDIINYLIGHYEIEIENVCLSRSVKSISELNSVLRVFDARNIKRSNDNERGVDNSYDNRNRGNYNTPRNGRRQEYSNRENKPHFSQNINHSNERNSGYHGEQGRNYGARERACNRVEVDCEPGCMNSNVQNGVNVPSSQGN